MLTFEFVYHILLISEFIAPVHWEKVLSTVAFKQGEFILCTKTFTIVPKIQ